MNMFFFLTVYIWIKTKGFFHPDNTTVMIHFFNCIRFQFENHDLEFQMGKTKTSRHYSYCFCYRWSKLNKCISFVLFEWERKEEEKKSRRVFLHIVVQGFLSPQLCYSFFVIAWRHQFESAKCKTFLFIRFQSFCIGDIIYIKEFILHNQSIY